MKKTFYIFIAFVAALALASCDNKKSVNVIVTNRQPHTIYNVPVSISMQEVCRLLSVPSVEKPIVLNEKNTAIPYQYNARHDTIRFIMPVIHEKSQKTFSVNSVMPSLGNSFLRNRKAIRIDK